MRQISILVLAILLLTGCGQAQPVSPAPPVAPTTNPASTAWHGLPAYPGEDYGSDADAYRIATRDSPDLVIATLDHQLGGRGRAGIGGNSAASYQTYQVWSGDVLYEYRVGTLTFPGRTTVVLVRVK